VHVSSIVHRLKSIFNSWIREHVCNRQVVSVRRCEKGQAWQWCEWCDGGGGFQNRGIAVGDGFETGGAEPGDWFLGCKLLMSLLLIGQLKKDEIEVIKKW
jgi:hypothetical protein